jgi:hypothetical protein
MGDFGNASSGGGSTSLGADTSSLFSDASLGDQMAGGSGDLFGGGTDGGSPDMSNLFADAGLGSALLGDSSGLGGLFTTTDPSGTQAATQSMTPAADVAGTPSGSDPSANIGGTQSGGAPPPNAPQNQQQQTTPAAAKQPPSPLAQIAKALGGAFGIGSKPSAGGPTGPTPQQAPGAGGQAGQQALANLLPTMPTPAETGELPPTADNIPPNQRNMPAPQNEQGETAVGSDQATPQPQIALGGGPGNASEVPTGTPAQPPAAAAKPAPAPAAAPATAAPPTVALPTKKGPQAPATPEAPPGPPQGVSGPPEGMSEILRDILGLALGSPTLLPMLAQMMGGRGHGRGGIPPWAMHGMTPFMRGRGRGFGGFRGGFLRPGYYPRRQGGWGFHPGGYHPGWGSWAPGQRGNQPMAFAGGGQNGQGGDGQSGGVQTSANTQSGGAPDAGAYQPGAGADQAYQSSGLGSNPLINTLVGQESAGGQNIVSRTDKDSQGRTLAQGGNPNEISQGYFQIQNHPGGTWTTYGRQAGVDLAKYPTPRSAPIDVQWKVAQLIPISAWGHDTQVAMQRRGFRYNPNTPLGQVAAQYGGTQTQVAGGGAKPANPSSSTSRPPATTRQPAAPPVQSDDYATQG